jgi:hypothetical protein
MKKRLTSVTVLFIFALGCSSHTSVRSQDKKPESPGTPAKAASVATPADAEAAPQPAQPMKMLRDRLLTSSAEDLGLSGDDAKAKVWGVLMEVAFPTGVATLMSMRDGTASLYTSTGGGILGGYTARNEAKRFVFEAEKHVANMKPAKSFPYPEAGRMKSYLLTRSGVYTADTTEEEVLREGHALSPLFRAGNDVLTVLRTANEQAKPADSP